MATLTAVDFDPFAQSADSGPTRITVRPGDALPQQPRLVPVEGNPFESTTSPSQQLATGFMNAGSAASQGTTPDIGAHSKNLISTDTYQNDAGEVLFRDPVSGELVPTDQNKHVALRDPADNRVKVYGRTTGFTGTDEGRLGSIARLFATGAAAGAPTARPALGAVTANIQPKASEVFSSAKPFYRAFDAEAGNVFVPAADTAERLKSAMVAAKQPEHLAGEVYQTADMLNKGGAKAPSQFEKLQAEMNREPLPVAPERMASLSELRDIKEILGKSARSPDARVRAAAGAAASELNKIISEASPSAGVSLKKADEIHATAIALQDLQRKEGVAGLRAGRAGYGGNAVNSMRQVLSPIIQRSIEGKTTPFRSNEIAAMRDIVEGTGATNTARLVGQMSPSKGAVPTIGAIGAVAAGGPTAFIIPALGAASNKLATVMTGRQIEALKTLVAKRSPAYAEAVSKAVSRYEQAQTLLASDPSPARLSAYVSASRSLASGLSHDGIKISADHLMRAIQGPMPGRADEKQQ